MYREKQKEENVNIVFDDGGIGDAIGRLPAVKYAHDMHPHVKFYLWIPDYFYGIALRSLPKRINIKKFTDGKHYNETYAGRHFAIPHHNNLACHITDNAFNMILNKSVENKYKNYLPVYTDDISIKRFGLPKNYIIVSTGFTAPVREFLPEHVNKVVQYIKFKNYTPVFLGKEEAHNGSGYTIKGNFREEINYDKGINLLNKTSLLETHAIIKNAKTIVGLDNGLLHLAGTTDIPIVGGFTTVDPEHRMPYRHDQMGWNYYPVVPTQDLKCRFCQSNWNFTYDHDFKECYYKDYLCIKQLNADLYIKELEKIL